MSEQMLPANYGVKFDFEISSATRPFDQVDAAADKHGIAKENRPDKPTKAQAIARAMLYLMRVCASSIEFPAWSPFNQWDKKKVGDKRNPNYSLKITQVKKLSTDTSVTWRINIADATKKGENMGHVISVTYDPGVVQPIYFTAGQDKAAFDTFGREVREIITNEYARFLNNYNDEDLRRVMDAELSSMHALKVIKNTNCFIPRDYVDRARALYEFAKDCGQVVSWLGLDNSDMTRNSLLADLRAVVMADMDEYERELDAKLNAPEGERKRGEKQRNRMFETANSTIDHIMAQAEYHATVLGCMAEGIIARRDALKAKAVEFLTRDFSKNTVATEASAPANVVVASADDPFEA